MRVHFYAGAIMLGHQWPRVLIVVLAVSGPVLHANDSTPALAPESQSRYDTIEPLRSPLVNTKTSALDAIAVRKIRLAPAPSIDGSSSARVTFDMYNEGHRRLTDIVLQVWLLEESHRDLAEAHRAVVAGSVTIRTKAVLLPEYSLSYEIRLRNVSSECGCIPRVDIVSARVLPDGENRDE
jgi:hypothetical protein